MENVEKNDVDISKLFSWGRVYEVIDPLDDSIINLVYMRLLGDADLNRARIYALRKSSELRRKLRDENSDERVAYIRPLSELDRDSMINLITILSSREITTNAVRNVKVKEPKQPKSNAKLEEVEKFQKEIDEYPAKRQEAVAKAVEKEVERLKKEQDKKTDEELYRDYVKIHIDEFCEKEAFEAFKNMQVFLGCYKDSSYKEKYFSDFEEFDNLESTMKENFKAAYDSIDVNMSELKKLRLATQ